MTYPPTEPVSSKPLGTQRIGPYRLLRVLGEGGMGVVYEAEQVEPVRRRVALKLIKAGMDTKAFVARFEVERQALAVMSHASIARVFDAGSIAGRPYYVMELVTGAPITDFCDENRLTTKQRLQLFVEVCNAVHHAHQKGIIHRDLKPSNVLVITQDDRPLPKIIDFGIAKALGRDLIDRTVITRINEAVGTPAYMSPEQWYSGTIDIDTRADIYSLGVMLFELLSGKLPYDAAELARYGNAAPQLIKNRATPTPSSRITALGAEASALAYLRHTDLISLLKELRGDVDWITCKCIDPDRTRRYETAHELSHDIARHLRSEPILARPLSRRYRAVRFFNRHRVAVGVALFIFLTAIAFSAVTAVEFRRTARERDRATVEAGKSRALNAFLERTLLSPDPIGGIGRDATMVQALDSASARISHEKITSPAVEASLKSAIGWAYYRLGVLDKAEPLLRSALRIRERLNPPDSSALAESLVRAAQLDDQLGRYDSAGSLFAKGLALRRATESSTSPPLAADLVEFGAFLREQGDLDRSRKLVDEARVIYSRNGDSLGLAGAENELGINELTHENPAGAQPHLEKSVALYRRSLGRHPLLARSLSILASDLASLKRPSEAEAAYREALDIAREKLGPDHEITTEIMNNFGVFLNSETKFDEAKPLLRDALLIDMRKLGTNNPTVAAEMINVAKAICAGSEDFDEGERWSARAVTVLSSQNQADQAWIIGQARIMHGTCLTRLERYPEAESEIRGGITALSAKFGPSHWRVDSARVRLSELMTARTKSGTR